MLRKSEVIFSPSGSILKSFRCLPRSRGSLGFREQEQGIQSGSRISNNVLIMYVGHVLAK